MEPTSSTASATAVHSNPCENLPEPASEAEKSPVAFGLNVRKEAADVSASVRKHLPDSLIDHDYCASRTSAETGEQSYILIPVTLVTPESAQTESGRKQESDMPSSAAVKDRPLSSSLDSFPESDDNPFDAAFKAAQSEAGKELENHNRSDVARLESRYGPILKSPEQKKLEQTLFTSTTRM
ncbi:hypothetical protein NX722_27250 [Endozoicomonas gorgoniicola]|uniref:Uncharacterized protein n=1 Tax=Endozoicomonas gorgoniicola TaxID=1234144 RepID=A0ABT3N3Q8_9GAMM|nr:hypothetical protein [Endozoicomonas gorgoniicola]MCW7556260.1 hypothetical protein [Endozoicomonas gorgoniicola]